MLTYIRNKLTDVYEKDLEGPDKEDSCGICVESFDMKTKEDGLKVKGLPQCEHYFHHDCIMEWVKKQVEKLQNPDCPLCRALFDPNDRSKSNLNES